MRQRTGTRWLLVAVAVLSMALAARVARADERVRGTVVRVQDDEIYFDLGAGARVEPGRPARVWRPISVKHPVTGKAVKDEIPLGAVTVQAVGAQLSLAVPAGALAYPVAVGDVVEVLVAAPPTPEPTPGPTPEPQPERAPLPQVDAETALVVETWTAQAGQPLDARIATWRRFLADHPQSPHADAIRAEIAELEALRARFAVGPQADRPSERAVGGLEHVTPTTWPLGRALGLAFLVSDTRIVGAWLHYRRAGDDTYRKVELAADGDGYLRGSIPAAEVKNPGVEYFVEVLTSDRQVGLAIGSPLQPRAVVVAPPRDSMVFADRRHRSRVSLSTSYLDFATFDDRPCGAGTARGCTRDRMFVFEADVLYRLRTRLYGIRVGFGVLDGEGGRRALQPAGEARPDSAFNYGYSELELRLWDGVALMARLIAGEGQDGLGFGIAGRLRLGDEEGTNLVLGASTLADVGFVSEIQFQWMAFPRFPLGLGIAIGDRPTEGDLGVRFSADVGVRAFDWFTPTLQLSYQGRSLQHSGLGAGLALVFDW
jgi:hypothetical protein